MSSHVYLLLALGFYTVGALHVLLHAVTRRRLLTSWTLTGTLLGFAVHTASLSQRWSELGYFPVVGLRDGTSFLAWAIVLVFLAIHVRTRMDALGLAVYPTVFGLVLVANLSHAAESNDPVLRSLFLPIHTTLAFFGFAALFVASAMGVLYLFQERELKSRSPRTFYYLIPSLENCDTVGGRSVVVGFGFLSLAIATGILWNLSAYGHYWMGTPKEWSTLVAWLIYVVLIVARRRTGWGGRRAALLGIAGFSMVAFTFLWMTLVAGPMLVGR
jgi:ABC-type transport system involved in cytochrome c biogenesis permease subunit